MLRRTFFAACASLVLFKNRIKEKHFGTFKIFENGKLIYSGKNEINIEGNNKIIEVRLKNLLLLKMVKL